MNSMDGIVCNKCGKKLLPEEVVLFWQFEICDGCNRELGGVIKTCVHAFMGKPADLAASQTEMTLTV